MSSEESIEEEMTPEEFLEDDLEESLPDENLEESLPEESSQKVFNWISFGSDDDGEYGRMDINQESLLLFSGNVEEAHQKWTNSIKKDIFSKSQHRIYWVMHLHLKLENEDIPEEFWNIPEENHKRIFNLETKELTYVNMATCEKYHVYNEYFTHSLKEGKFRIGNDTNNRDEDGDYENLIEFYKLEVN